MIVTKLGDMIVVNVDKDNFYCEREGSNLVDIWEEHARYIGEEDTLYVRQVEGEDLSEDMQKLIKNFRNAGKTIEYMDKDHYHAYKGEVRFHTENFENEE